MKGEIRETYVRDNVRDEKSKTPLNKGLLRDLCEGFFGKAVFNNLLL